ncbi:nucleoside-diphosphate-sugar epimerase [Nonlabens xylanidelens]|uniref:Nucleoside-diphosphate-sugar epimerase n=1 Tax=Nonlabens xylanidelens TaxID=191564 RepID=A0A2S6IGI7_9FLAO|nr:NAD-dependent epimerase/dehydratase family protein [Nonlabens xylanidelens]PPK93270.1 nucleoside-diphosphate-sugar epimerase [Nonlabens xylanidelens]PQJ20908.1 hypothetical protein BST94_05305 [Nonlabens xylanidelens]
MNHKIIISGATGFVGKNLVPFLENKNWSVTPLSRKREQNNTSLNYENLTVDDFNAAYAFIHLAGKAHDLKKTSLDDEYYEVNTELTKSLFDLFLQSDSKVFIYFSSVKAVADEVKGTLKEDHPYEPGTVYGKSKALAEQYLLSKTIPSDKKLYILRPCMIHGPGNKGNLNLLYKVVSKGIPYPLASFDNKRSFVSVTTITEVIENLLTRLPNSDVFNMADDYSISTNELIKVMAIAIDKKPKLISINSTFIKWMASVGTLLRLPFNKERLQKLTESYEVSNKKMKTVLKIDTPFDTKYGLTTTIQSFKTI